MALPLPQATWQQVAVLSGLVLMALIGIVWSFCQVMSAVLATKRKDGVPTHPGCREVRR